MEEAFKKFIKEQSYCYGSRVMDPEEPDHALAKAAFEAGFNASITEDDEKELGEYVVQVLGDDFDDFDYEVTELSVVRLNHHGEETKGNGSWGWADEDKIILLDGVVGEEYSFEHFERMKKVAQIVATFLNAEDQEKKGK